MKTSVEAVFERGVLRPLSSLGLAEGKHVRITIERADESAEQDPLDLAAAVYAGLEPGEIDEIERVALARGDFFGDGSR
ncbi:MAG: antitoxin family protein [Acidobacteriota bacterium]